MKITAATAILLSAVGSFAQSQAKPEVWMCHPTPEKLLEKDASWDYVKEHLDVMQLFTVWITTVPMDALRELVQILNENNIGIAVECGGTLDYGPMDETNGVWSAQHEMVNFKKLTDAGAKIRYLNLDHPIRRLMEPTEGRKGFDSIDKAADQLVIYMQTVRATYPDIEFLLISNFPNWGYRGGISYHAIGPNRQHWGEYEDVITTVLRKTREAKIPIAGLTVDNPYDFAIGKRPSTTLKDPTQVNWMKRVRDLEDYAVGEGLDFGLFVNDEGAGMTSDEAFYRETLKFVDAYRAAGGSPKRFIVESWYDYPKAVAPETAPFTMTALVKDVIKKVKGTP